MLEILNSGARNAYEVASKMSWDIKCDRWEDFPLAQKWFATGEALSHLRYLEEKGTIFTEDRNTVRRFALTQQSAFDKPG